jgi:1,2-diacylglycerol 3-beta-galactosyltransferase
VALADVRAPISVLILFSDTGGGHRAAARALARALQRLDPDLRLGLCDPLIGEPGASVVRHLISLYPRIIQRSPSAWGAIYHLSNLRPAFATLRVTFGGSVRRILESKLAEHDPDVVVSVHPLLNHVAWAAIACSSRSRGLMTVVTDLLEFHRGWAFPQADLVVVPTEQARRSLVRCHVAGDRVKVLGMPVDLRFRPAQPGEKAALRAGHGLAGDRPTVLVTGGGDGSGKLLQTTLALAWEPHEWQLIVVCGRNQALRQRLERLRFGTPVRVLGFVDDMPDLLRASDLVVTKAGPGAISEALATGLPLVLTSYLPGQETPNVDFVLRHGVGVYAPRSDQVVDAVRRLLGGGSSSAMVARAAAIGRPDASLDIARECLALGERYRAASQVRR